MYRVMIVDDERPVRAGLVSSVPWAEADCEVAIEAGNGAEALRLMEQNLPDVALIDLEMPVMGGMDLIREIRKRGWPVDVVILTCHANFAYAQEAIRLDVFDYVLKLSASPANILDVLRRTLVRRIQKQGGPELMDVPENAGPGTVLALMLERSSGGYDGVYTSYRALLNDWERIFDGDMRHVRLFQLDGEGLACMFPGKRPDELKEVAQKLIDSVQNRTGRKATVGVSDFSTVCGTETVALAKARAQLRFYHGHSRIYAYESFPENWKDDAELLSPVELLAMTRDDMDVLASVREAVPKLYGRRPEMVRFSCVEWLYALSVRARRKGRTLVEPLMDLKQISQHIDKISTYEQLRQEVLCATKELTEQEAISRLSEAVQMTAQMIRNNPESGESLMEIAQRIGCSYCYLSSQFKLEMGVGFSEFRNRLRVQKAMMLLTDTDQGLAEIAETLGYSSPYYFSAAFKKVTGVAPAAWRSREE